LLHVSSLQWIWWTVILICYPFAGSCKLQTISIMMLICSPFTGGFKQY
jgi:hypothetical protein